MKICKNCNAENHDEVHKCVHCHMADDFRPKGEALFNAPHHSDEEARQCLNCGHSKPGEGPKCMHCHFPLQDGEKPVHAIPKKTEAASKDLRPFLPANNVLLGEGF